MRKTRKASSASTPSGGPNATRLKAKSLSELRELQRLAGAPSAPTPAPESAKQAGRRPHRFLPPRPGPVAATAAEPTAPARKQPHDSDVASLAPPAGPKAARSAATQPALPSGAAPARSARPSFNETAVSNALSPEDIALFRRVTQSVAPGPKSDRLILAPVPPATAAQLKQRRQQAMGLDPAPALDVSDHYASGHLEHDDTVFLQAGQGPHLIKGLKKGKWPVQASLDLHGSTLDHARERMDRFIQSCRDHDIRCVRIVHGKGYGSKNGNPVLKETVRRWLSQLAVVQAYVESDEANGGAGAVVVLLSKANK